MTSESFNRYVTLGLFLFFGALYIVSFATGKSLDWQALIAFVIPMVNHIVSQVTTTQLATKRVEGATATTVATIQTTGTANNTPPTVPAVKP